MTPAGGAQANALTGVVGPGSAITLSSSDGTAVRQLAPGTYTFAIRDLADDHNFHLTGSGVERKTGVAEIVDTTWTVTLGAGTYTFLCDPHPTSMRGQFTVSDQTATLATVVATVGPKRTLTLAKAGKKVSTLTAGRYRIVVKDKSANDNIHIIGPDVNRRTPVASKAAVTWIVTLKAGSYTFRSDSSAALTNVLRVTTS